MHNLHNITEIIAYIWAKPYGANGQPIGGNLYHAYEIQRGTPPPIDDTSRRYWHPFSRSIRHTRESILNPVCGPLQSRSQRPQLTEPSRHGMQYLDTRLCQRCQELRPEAATRDVVQQRDPWSGLQRALNWNEPDPVTGL